MKTLQTNDPILLSKWDNKSDKLEQSTVNMRGGEREAKEIVQDLTTFLGTISLSKFFIKKHFEGKYMTALESFFNLLVHSSNCTACHGTLFKRNFLGFGSCHTWK